MKGGKITLSLYHYRLLHVVMGLPVPPECERATVHPREAAREDQGWIDLTPEQFHAVFERSRQLHARTRRSNEPESIGAILGRKAPRTPPDDAELSDTERARFLTRAASLGADEHRIRCELGGRWEELEHATWGTAKAVIRQLEQEQRATAATTAARGGEDHATV